MDMSKISLGKNPPQDINVIVQNPMHSEPVRYAVCRESGAMFVDRFLHTSMVYPVNYGFIPHTLGHDGEPVDAMVIGRYAVAAGAVIRARPVGVLLLEDENGADEKILAVPHPKLRPFNDDVASFEDLPKTTLRQIEHFFAHWKDLETGKWTEFRGWAGPDKAAEVIEVAMRRAARVQRGPAG